MTRRTFAQTIAAAAATRAVGADGAKLKLGFDTYTLRGFGWKSIALLDYASRMKLDTIQLDLNTYESLDRAYVQSVHDHAAKLGIRIDSSMGCICPTSSSWKAENRDPITYLRTGLKIAKAVGANCTRVFMGGSTERQGFESHVDSTLKVLRAVRAEAVDLGIRIAIENHGDFQAWELKELIETAGKEYVGACLDPGNAVSAIEDPMVTLDVLGPYVVTSHIRDSVIFEHPRGAVTQWVALGDGIIDFKAFFARYRQICPDAGVQLEILTGGRPRVVPYLEPEFWKAFPKARAAEFSLFLALAKKGHPFMGSMVVEAAGQNDAYDAALREQQRFDLERSFVYAKTVLGLGAQT